MAAGDGDVEEEVEVGDGAVPPRRLPRRRRRRRWLRLLLLLPAIPLHGWLALLARPLLRRISLAVGRCGSSRFRDGGGLKQCLVIRVQTTAPHAVKSLRNGTHSPLTYWARGSVAFAESKFRQGECWGTVMSDDLAPESRNLGESKDDFEGQILGRSCLIPLNFSEQCVLVSVFFLHKNYSKHRKIFFIKLGLIESLFNRNQTILITCDITKILLLNFWLSLSLKAWTSYLSKQRYYLPLPLVDTHVI
jgi:hypothetical protein